MISDLLSLRKAMGVKRYHTETLLVPETNGHHSSNVALILIWMYKDLGIQPRMLRAAILHDAPEVYTGDSPAPVKWEYPELEKQLRRAEQDFWDRLKHQRGGWEDPYRALTAYEKAVLKFADMADLCLKCLEEISLGNDTVKMILINGIVALEDRSVNIPETVKPKAVILMKYIEEIWKAYVRK